MSGNGTRKVLVVGGGVIGLCTAYYAALRGHEVTVLEREPAQRDGCSFGNAGMIVPSHFVPLAAPGMVALGLKWMWNPESPFYIRPRLDWDLFQWGWKFWRSCTASHVARSAPLIRDLSLQSRSLFESIARSTTRDFGLTQKGLLMLCKQQKTLEEEGHTAEKARQLGIPAEVLDARATAKLDPNVTMDIVGSVYFPKDCHLSPGRFMAALQDELLSRQARFEWGTEVLRWNLKQGRIQGIETDRGNFEADEYVLCGGSWSPSVARDLPLCLPMQGGKGYSLTVQNPRELPQICSIFTEARIAVTPMGSTLRFGGTMEIAGLREEINPARIRGIVKNIPRYYPRFTPADFESIQPWYGFRPCSPDGLPYVGRTARIANLIVATGHAMMGLSLGPVTGHLVGQLLSREKPDVDLALLSPDRY